MIVSSNTIVDPATVMIKIRYAYVTNVTVFARRMGYYFTVGAERSRFILRQKGGDGYFVLLLHISRRD